MRVSSLVLVLGAFCLSSAQNQWIPIGASSNPRSVSQWYIDQVEAEVNLMRSRWSTLDGNCDTNAVFALTYLYMTNALHTNVAGLYFDDGELMANFTKAFAARYSAAIDAFIAEQNGAGPQTITDPWREAFDYGDSDKSSVQEDLVLGMNAHINYDLGQVVYQLNYGTTANKPDYDRINDILAQMSSGVSNDLCGRYDPAVCSGLLGALQPAILQLLYSWRENAWQKGVALMGASTQNQRNLILQQMENEAMLAAATQESYNVAGGGCDTAPTRLAFCSTHHYPSLL